VPELIVRKDQPKRMKRSRRSHLKKRLKVQIIRSLMIFLRNYLARIDVTRNSLTLNNIDKRSKTRLPLFKNR